MLRDKIQQKNNPSSKTHHCDVSNVRATEVNVELYQYPYSVSELILSEDTRRNQKY